MLDNWEDCPLLDLEVAILIQILRHEHSFSGESPLLKEPFVSQASSRNGTYLPLVLQSELPTVPTQKALVESDLDVDSNQNTVLQRRRAQEVPVIDTI